MIKVTLNEKLKGEIVELRGRIKGQDGQTAMGTEVAPWSPIASSKRANQQMTLNQSLIRTPAGDACAPSARRRLACYLRRRKEAK